MGISSVSAAAVTRPTAFTTPQTLASDEAANTASPDSSATSVESGSEKKAASGAAGYISPFLRYDQGARMAVLLFRDVDTGATQDQIPSQRVVEEYRRNASRLTLADSATTTGTQSTGTQSAGQNTGASGSTGNGSTTSGSESGSAGGFGGPVATTPSATASGTGATTGIGGTSSAAQSFAGAAATGTGAPVSGGSSGRVSVTV